jgi:hypothetical protein
MWRPALFGSSGPTMAISCDSRRLPAKRAYLRASSSSSLGWGRSTLTWARLGYRELPTFKSSAKVSELSDEWVLLGY